MTYARLFFLIALLFADFAAPAQAADAVYPVGSRIGLVPPPGMTPSSNFSGFEDRDKRVALVIAALPAVAYPDIEKTTTPDSLQKQGMTLEAREEVAHPLGKAMLFVGHQQIEGQRIHKWVLVVGASELTAIVTVQVPDAAQSAYPDAAIRTALMSVAVRATVPAEEQLSLLPFRVSELAGFKVGGVIAGRAVMLTDGKSDDAKAIDTHILVAIAVGAPAQASDRGRFAPEVLRRRAEPEGSAHQLGRAAAYRRPARPPDHGARADGATGEEVTIVQWLRFGGSAYLHLVGVARSDGWTQAYARFRQVRDGIELR